MEIKLTTNWKTRIHSQSSDAQCGHIYLQCYNLVRPKNRWSGSASICLGEGFTRMGPIRKSIKAAQQDAKRLAVELLRDIRDGTKELMAYYNIPEDD